MIIGTIGIIMLGLGLMRYITHTLSVDAQGYGLSLLGFCLVLNYIYSLEKKAGISNKIVWIQSGVSILIIGVLSSILYL